jgi:hypothetical protein
MRLLIRLSPELLRVLVLSSGKPAKPGFQRMTMNY